MALIELVGALLVAAAPAKPAAVSVTVDGKGLSLAAKAGKPVRLGFGLGRSAAGKALSVLGPAKVGTTAECDGGPVTAAKYANGLTVNYMDGKLAGWWLDKPATGVATAKGIRPGSSRAAMMKAHRVESFDSSLGDEFQADADSEGEGGFGGFFDEKDKNKVAELYAGAICVGR